MLNKKQNYFNLIVTVKIINTGLKHFWINKNLKNIGNAYFFVKFSIFLLRTFSVRVVIISIIGGHKWESRKLLIRIQHIIV